VRSRADCERLDATDPLAGFRDRFALEPGLVYLDGNSLGAMPRGVPARLAEVAEEWSRQLIGGWNRGWVDLPGRLAARLAPLLGARPGDVAVADNASVNLYKALAAALTIQGGRGPLVVEEANFPTDLYVAAAAAGRFGGRSVARVPRPELLERLTPGSVVTVSHVDYRSGHLLDLDRFTTAAHAAGALVVWDLCHSAGALPLSLDRAGADFAVGCTYKFLCAGPGAPAFLYVADRHLGRAETPLPGWFGHARTFDFAPDYEPAPDAARFQTGTPNILGLVGLEVALELWAEVDLEAVRRKSIALGDLVVERVEAVGAGLGLELASPRTAAERGSQVTLRHREAYALSQALSERGVITDCRPPDLLRIGLTPLYTRYVEVWDAVEALLEVLASGAQREERFAVRQRVP
jgi:kynureninase